MVNILPVKYNIFVFFWWQGGEGEIKDGVTEGGQLQQVHRNPTYRPRYRRSVQFLCSVTQMLLCSTQASKCGNSYANGRDSEKHFNY